MVDVKWDREGYRVSGIERRGAETGQNNEFVNERERSETDKEKMNIPHYNRGRKHNESSDKTKVPGLTKELVRIEHGVENPQ